MTICIFVATERGYRFLKKVASLVPAAQFIVFSFREEPFEPPFLDNIRGLTESLKGTFVEARNAGNVKLESFWAATPVDLMLCASWRYMIPAHVYQRAKRGAFVFHDSLLPAYRGFSPTVWALVNGESRTGVTLFEIAEQVDSGDIIDQQELQIAENETITSLLERVTGVYLDLIERNLERLLNGSAPRTKQDESRATYTCKRVLADNRIDWRTHEQQIFNLIRASTRPYPGAFCFYQGQEIKIWGAERTKHRRYVGSRPGRVVEVWPERGSVVQTGNGVLLLTEVQVGAGEPRCAAAVLRSLLDTLE